MNTENRKSNEPYFKYISTQSKNRNTKRFKSSIKWNINKYLDYQTIQL